MDFRKDIGNDMWEMFDKRMNMKGNKWNKKLIEDENKINEIM